LSKSNLPDINNCRVAIIGLGYVGLPLAIALAKKKRCFLTKKSLKRDIVGFDANIQRVEELNKGLDRNKIFKESYLNGINNLKITNKKKYLKNIDIYLITVPTPLNDKKEPDLSFIKRASMTVGESIKSDKKNKIIIYESTVYPGVTEDICVPIIKVNSGKVYNSEKYKDSFYCGYSPERINPGDKKHTVNSIVKVTSGCNKKIATFIDKFYGSFIEAGTFRSSSIKVAEAAKIIENTQRDINIALVNELSIFFRELKIDTNEVLKAAHTKWNFHKYRPGLVGGHCIGVDPYYLTYKAKQIGFNTKLISAGRTTNDYMYLYLFEQIKCKLESRKEKIKNKKILLLGLAYKSNCSDIRNSQLINLIEKIKNLGFYIDIVDPRVDKEEVRKKTGLLSLKSIPHKSKYALIIFALYHNEFKSITVKYLNKISYQNTIIFDLTNQLNGKNILHL